MLREGVRLVEERETRLALLNASLAAGLADADAGRVAPAAEVGARLAARYETQAKARTA